MPWPRPWSATLIAFDWGVKAKKVCASLFEKNHVLLFSTREGFFFEKTNQKTFIPVRLMLLLPPS
jgi:hypothetical protein